MYKPEFRKEWVTDYIVKNPNATYSECYAKYAKKFAKSRRTFDFDWRAANDRVKTMRANVNKAKEEAIIKKEVRGLAKGIKQRIERVMFLQNEIDRMQQQLTGELPFKFLIGSKSMDSHNLDGEFILPVQVMNELRREIRMYQAEISKLEGDYAPAKVAQTDSNGKSVSPKLSLVLPTDMNLQLPSNTEDNGE